MDWADLSVNTLAPWSIVAMFVYSIVRGKLIPRASADKEIELIRESNGILKERLGDKDQVIAQERGDGNIQRSTITEQAGQIRVLAELVETTNRVLNALEPRADANESS